MKKNKTTERPALTKRQEMVMNFISDSIDECGFPPTLREIGLHMGISSTNGVSDHLKALEKKGYLQREGLRARALTPITKSKKTQKPDSSTYSTHNLIDIPLLGKVAAGNPIERIENPLGNIHLDKQLIGRQEDIFALTVSGDSMMEDGIYEGDTLFVHKQSVAKNGETVVAVVNDEVTVKRFYKEKGSVRLQPANAAYSPILFDSKSWEDVQILGIAIGIFRKL